MGRRRMSEQCPRVQARIECPECWYPASEARYGLHEVADPGCFPPQHQLIKELEELAELLK